MKLLKVAFFGLGLAIAVSAVSGPVLADDVKAGKAVFKKKCKVCHRIGKNKTGPNLAGVVGRPAGWVEGLNIPSHADIRPDLGRGDPGHVSEKAERLGEENQDGLCGLKKAKDCAADRLFEVDQ